MPQQRPRRCTRLFPNMHKEGALFPLATARHKYEIDMCTGSLPQKILLFSLPLMATGMLQLLFNAADIIVVGRYVGSHALAAVGSNGSIINLIVNLFMGISIGGSAVIAQHYGAAQYEDVSEATHTCMLVGLISGFFVMVVGVVCTPAILRLMDTPDDVLPLAILYLRIYFLGMIPQMLYNMGTNILRAIGDSKRPLYFLIAASLVNIVLDVVFIAVFGWGVMGAALATVLSQVASAVLTLRCIVGSQGMPWHIRTEKLRLHGDVFTAICTIGVPAAAQSAMYNISNMFIQSSMNSFGTSTIAAWGVYGKIDFLFWMTINSLGIAITTFAGQNFGARQYDRVRRGVRVCLAMAACTTLVISFTFYNLAEVLFRLFSQDDAVVAVGVGMMHVLTPVYITYVCIEVLAGALRGCGDVRVPTLITVFFVCGLRMLWLFIAVPIRHEVATVEMSYPITWSLASALFILYYVKGGWMQRCAEKWEKKQAG